MSPTLATVLLNLNFHLHHASTPSQCSLPAKNISLEFQGQNKACWFRWNTNHTFIYCCFIYAFLRPLKEILQIIYFVMSCLIFLDKKKRIQSKKLYYLQNCTSLIYTYLLLHASYFYLDVCHNLWKVQYFKKCLTIFFFKAVPKCWYLSFRLNWQAS